MSENRQRVYLDHNATSTLRPEAMRAIVEVLERLAGNASSIHREGRAARTRVEAARAQVALLAGGDPREVVFTSGGSEAIAAAIHGVCEKASAGRRRIVAGATEHSSVLEAARSAARRGFETVEVRPRPDGAIDPDGCARYLDDRTALVAIQAANHETGVIQPIAVIGDLARDRGIIFLVDAVQAAGKIPLGPIRDVAHLVALSAHKIGGPQGVGALLVREGTGMAPLIPGGAQEKRRRGGTEAVALIAGFGAAAAVARAGLREDAARLDALRIRIEERLRAGLPGVRIHGDGATRLPNTVNFGIPDVPGESLVIALDLAGFAVSTGSACASGAVEPSHVLLAMGLGEPAARAAVRVSMGWSTTAAEVEAFLDALPRIAHGVRAGLGTRP